MGSFFQIRVKLVDNFDQLVFSSECLVLSLLVPGWPALFLINVLASHRNNLILAIITVSVILGLLAENNNNI